MFFKKSMGNIFGVVFTPKEQKAINEEIRRQVMSEQQQRLIKRFEQETDIEEVAMVMYMLHRCFGFGPTRLKRFHDFFYTEGRKLLKLYEIEKNEDEKWLATYMLEKMGCDVKQWQLDLNVIEEVNEDA